MSDTRPTVSPKLIATVIESAPNRVRRRLDRTPDAAAGWDWQAGAKSWSVDTGGETVTLPRAHIDSVDQLQCTCLLSPKCFHVLACLTALEVTIADDESDASEQAPTGADVESEISSANKDDVQPGDKQQRAAAELATSIAQLLRVGVASAGVVVQSGLLRGGASMSREGLHRAAAVGLRVIADTNQVRSSSPESDPGQLAQDIADVLETTRHILSGQPVPGYWVGTARRKQLPVRPRKLHGLLAEPIITRSGYAGAAVYFLGEDDHIYTASDVRPGDAQRARDAYLGGVEIGSLIQPARQLARGQYLGTDLTASQDGRLGRGKGIKTVEQGNSSWDVEAVERRFARTLSEQCSAVYEMAALPADARPAGWDFVFLNVAVVGALGPELLVQLTSEGQPVRLAIENENDALRFRENLRMLSHAPGLELKIIARLDLQEPTIAYPLAVAGVAQPEQDDRQPRLELPDSLQERVCLGFDEIQRKNLPHAEAGPVVLGEPNVQPADDPLAALRRRWIAMMLSSTASQRQSNTNTVAAETAILNRNGFATGASLLDALSRSHSAEGPTSIDTFLAVALYLRSCRYELAKSQVTV